MIYILPKYIKALPSGFITILVLSSLAIYLDLDTKRIGDLASISESFPSFSIPKIHINLDAILTVLPYALLLACVSNIESLMTVSLLDELDEKKGNVNQECIAIGAGNITCGFLGATAGSGMISQSVVNFTNGAQGRFSSLFVSVFIIIFILFLSEYISLIPVAVLIGILITVPLFLFQWQNNHQLKKLNNKEKFILVLVTAITCIAPLEMAFLISIVLAFSLYIMNNFSLKSKVFLQNNEKTYEIHGPLYFNLVTKFLNFFDLKNDPKIIVIDFKHAKVMDHSALMAIDSLAAKYRAVGKSLHLRHLSPDCQELLESAKAIIEVNLLEDPKYRVSDDKLA
jgi:SulP family sulfate permease